MSKRKTKYVIGLQAVIGGLAVLLGNGAATAAPLEVIVSTTTATDGHLSSDGNVNTASTRLEVGSRTSGGLEVEQRTVFEFDISALAAQFSSIDSVVLQVVDDASVITNGTLKHRTALADDGSVGDVAVDHILGDGTIATADFDSAALSTVGTILTVAEALDGVVAGLTIDVTAQLQDDLSNGRLFSAFRMYMPGSGWSDGVADVDVLRFQSASFNNPADAPRPRLIISGTEVPEPGSAFLILGGLSMLLRKRRSRVNPI